MKNQRNTADTKGLIFDAEGDGKRVDRSGPQGVNSQGPFFLELRTRSPNVRRRDSAAVTWWIDRRRVGSVVDRRDEKQQTDQPNYILEFQINLK